MNKYFTIFLRAGASFGLALGIFFTVQNQSITPGIVSGLIGGSLFGFTTAALSYTADCKLRSNGIPTGNANTRQVILLEVDRSINELFSVCKESLRSLRHCKMTYANQEDGVVHGAIGISWKSFGELIHLSLKPMGANKTVIEIKGKPKLPTTLVDCSKNKENVERIAEFIRRMAWS